VVALAARQNVHIAPAVQIAIDLQVRTSVSIHMPDANRRRLRARVDTINHAVVVAVVGGQGKIVNKNPREREQEQGAHSANVFPQLPACPLVGARFSHPEL
jgi:hypothetical protein